MDEKAIRKNLIQLRISKKLSKTEVADRLEIDRCTYGKIENGPSFIINKYMPKLAKLFGVSEEYLILGYEPSRDAASQIAMLQSRIDAMETQIKALQESLEAYKKSNQDKDYIISVMRSGTQRPATRLSDPPVQYGEPDQTRH